jgi:hypothetical protein
MRTVQLPVFQIVGPSYFYVLRVMVNKRRYTLLEAIRFPYRALGMLMVMTVALPGLVHAQTATDTVGTVYLMRRTGYSGFMDGYSIFMDGWRICTLNNKKYSVHQVPAGEHRFSVRFNGSNEKEEGEFLTVVIERGREYYLMVDQRNGFNARVTLQELAGSSGKKAMEQLTKDQNCE